LLPAYALVGLLIYATQGGHGEVWRAKVEMLLRAFPVLGSARQCLALARLSLALEGLLNAGVSIIQAWELAASASGSPALRRTVLAWRPLVEAGHTPAEVLTESGAFPEIFVSQYASGELSGKLDETLGRMHRYYQEEGSRKIRLVTQWLPRLFYLAVVLAIAYRVVRFWSSYFQQIRDAGGF
jgi:type II secretory pathway component PulF